MKFFPLAPVMLLTVGALTACGGSSSSTPAPDLDTTAPVITLNGDVTVTHNVGTPYIDLGATANDVTDGSVDVTTTGTVDSEVLNSYTLTYSATDAAGNATTTTRTVNVVDTVAPVLTLNGAATISVATAQDYTELNATVVDNVDTNVTVVVTGDVLTTAGTYTISYNAADASGNDAIAVTRAVTIEPDIVPATFSFTPQTEVFLKTFIESNQITVAEVNTAVLLSVTNGEYSIDNGAYSNLDTTVTLGQNIKVRSMSAITVNELTQTSLTVGSLTQSFDTTTRTTEPSGLFAGTGTVNGATSVNLVDVKGMIYNEHFMLFDEAENVLYDGTIASYSGDTFTATVDVYKNGLFVKQEPATGTIASQNTIAFVLTGTGYGVGTIDVAYDGLYTRGATQERFKTIGFFGWIGLTNTVNQGQVFGFGASFNDNTFYGGTRGMDTCEYDNNSKEILADNVNLFEMKFDSNHIGFPSDCDHLGVNFTGFSTIIDGGTRSTDGTMWFAAANGEFATFSVMDYH